MRQIVLRRLFITLAVASAMATPAAADSYLTADQTLGVIHMLDNKIFKLEDRISKLEDRNRAKEVKKPQLPKKKGCDPAVLDEDALIDCVDGN